MKIYLYIVILLIISSNFAIAQKGLFFSPDGDRYYGDWSGEINYVDGKPYVNGEGTFKAVNAQNTNQWFRYTGKTKNGYPNGYGSYFEHINGTGLIEGEFYNGKLHGRCIIKTSSGTYISGNFKYGKLYGKGAIKSPESKLMEIECDGFDLSKMMSTGIIPREFPCTKEYDNSNILIGAAMVISSLAVLFDEHTSISDFINCASQYGVTSIVGNPIYAGAASEAINSLYSSKGYSWVNMSQNSIENYLSAELKENGYSNLSNSIDFVSYVGCILSDSK